MTIETKKVASANEAIEIINRLNYYHDTFCYTRSTFSNDYTVEYRHFDAYRQNGETDSFAIIEIVVNGKLEVVRFFNLFLDITVDLKLGDFNPDYSRYDEVINVENESATKNEKSENDAELVNQLKTFSAKVHGLSCEEFLAETAGLSIAEYREQKATVENEIANLELEFKIEDLKIEIANLESENYYTARNLYSVAVLEKSYATDESLQAYAAELVDEFNNRLAKINEAQAELATLASATADAEATTATNANEEIINATDDIIITEDAYTQMIRSELANAQIASGNYGIQINGEWVYFYNHKITRIDAGEFSFEYTLQGRKQFHHNGRVISRDGVIKFFENKETAKTQEKSFREFFINPDAPKHGFFQVMISPTFVDDCEHNYGRYFEYYADAIDFVNNAIEFCGDVPTHITIKRNKQAGKVYYHRMPDGTVHIDKPDTDFFKNYSADEIQSRIDEIDRAIKENGDFTDDAIQNQKYGVTFDCNINRANDLLAVTKNFYEFVLHETAPVTIAETDGSEEDDFTDELPALIPAENNEDDELVDPPEIEFDENIFIGQDGTNYIIRAKKLNITVEDRKIKINGHIVAKYKTDAGVAAAFKYVTDWSNNIANYKTFDINDYNTVFDDFDFAGGNENKFVYIDDEPAPTDKVITPDEMLALVDTLDTVNAAAPYGWRIDYDGKNFPVEFNGKTVATLDSLALAKALPPDKFFALFNTEVPPREQYINERRKELDMLLDFRKFVENAPDRLNTLANLIEDVKREILDAELDTEHPPDAENPPDSAG